MASSFIMPGQIIYGNDSLTGEESKQAFRFAGKKALIVTGPVMQEKCGILKGILEELDIEYSIFAEITGEPNELMIADGVKEYLDNNCDFMIAFGGGSPLDAMKAIGVLVVENRDISDYMGKVIDVKMPKMIAIPTTAGTGSEATQFTIITDTKTNIKMLLKGRCLMPDVAIIDPQFTISAPKDVTAATGLDALCHAVEAYTSKKAQYMTDIYAKSAVVKIFKYLPRCYSDGNDVEARREMSLAALEAGIAFNNSSVTIIHGMSRPIGALFHVAHGISNAMLMKECLSFAMPGAVDRFADLGRAIGVAGENDSNESGAVRFLNEIDKLLKTLEIPTFKEYGIDKTLFFELIDKMASDAIASGSPANTVRNITKEDVINIYKNMWF